MTTGTSNERNLYENKAKAELNLLKGRLDVLRAKIANTNADARIKLQQELDNLEGKKRGLEQKMIEARAVAASAWDEVRAGFDTARKELAEGLEHIAAKLR